MGLRNLLVDRITAEVSREFSGAGIPNLVLKGPAIAQWLYDADEVRSYFDSDLMVARAQWDDAVSVLERMGFVDEQAALGHPRMEGFSSYAFVRRDDHVDLHCTLTGIEADLDTTWAILESRAEPIVIDGVELRAFDRPARLMHIALHAAHHHEGRPMIDLERALDRATDAEWQQAAEAARALDALPFFTAGLRLLPAGERLAERLGVAGEVSPEATLRVAGVPLAEGLHELSSVPGLAGKLRLVAHETFPRPEFMRWWLPLARRGRRGLLAAYAYRPFWLLLRVPRAVLYVWRARRAARR